MENSIDISLQDMHLELTPLGKGISIVYSDLNT